MDCVREFFQINKDPRMKGSFLVKIWFGGITLDKNMFDQETNEANIELNRKLEDSELHTSTNGLPESVGANLKLQEAMNAGGQNAEELSNTYMYNNTPAIKINKEKD